MQYIQKHNIQYLYHMTDLRNLASVLQHGLLSHNEAHRRGLVSVDISNQEVNQRRGQTSIDDTPLHDYVNFYFQPKNPMLSVKRDIQSQIVFLGVDPRLLLEKTTVFSDGNAAADSTTFYRGTNSLDRLPWEAINAAYWNNFADGKRIKCAEILVYPKVEISSVLRIFCHPAAREATVQIVAASDLNIFVEVAHHFYF